MKNSLSKRIIKEKGIESKFRTLSQEQQITVLFKTLVVGQLPRPFLERFIDKELSK